MWDLGEGSRKGRSPEARPSPPLPDHMLCTGVPQPCKHFLLERHCSQGAEEWDPAKEAGAPPPDYLPAWCEAPSRCSPEGVFPTSNLGLALRHSYILSLCHFPQ